MVLGYPIEAAQANLADFKALFPPLHNERGILEPWERLVVTNRVSGKQAHDTRLIAAIERHELTHLLTFDSKDFPRYGSVQILNPRKFRRRNRQNRG